MRRVLLIFIALSGALAVILGAFGAHAMEDFLIANNRLDTFQTAVQYHFYHTLAAMLSLLLLKNTLQSQKAEWSALIFLIGTVLFSGSLYLLCFSGLRWVAFITPIGGVFFIIGWLYLSYAAYRTRFE